MQNKNWNIRKALIEDAENLKCCMIAAYSVYLERLKGIPLPPMNVDYTEEIKSYPVWVAESGNKIVGGLILIFDKDHVSLANIAVHTDFQGHGLGKGLMQFAEDEAINRGYKEIRLATHILLTENVAYYNKLGWTETGRDETRIYFNKFLK